MKLSIRWQVEIFLGDDAKPWKVASGADVQEVDTESSLDVVTKELTERAIWCLSKAFRTARV